MTALTGRVRILADAAAGGLDIEAAERPSVIGVFPRQAAARARLRAGE